MRSAVSISTLLVSTISHVREWNADCEFEYKRALSVCLTACLHACLLVHLTVLFSQSLVYNVHDQCQFVH